MFAALHIPHPDDPPSAAALRDLASSLTPDFEETTPRTLLLDLFSLPRVEADPEGWIESTLRGATIPGCPLHLSLASTPDLAHLAALSPATASTLSFAPDPVFCFRPPLQSALRTPPSAFHSLALPHAEFRIPHSDLLRLWGLHSLGDLAALPRQGLAERLGPEIAHLHDILHGKHRRLLRLHRPPVEFHTVQDLESPLQTLEPLLFLLNRTLDTLTARLAAAQRAARALHLSLTFDDGNLHLRELRIAEPTRDPQALLRLLHTHLDTLAAPAPVVAFSLRLIPTLPAEAQHHLFERSLRDPNKFADTLARLEALLGDRRLGSPCLLDSHHPEAFHMRSAEGGLRKSSPSSRIPASNFRIQTALPLTRFRPPIPVHVACESRGRHPRPLALLDGPHQGSIVDTRGPFPLSGHWWDPTDRWKRTEWDVELPGHTLLRLAHLPPDTWQLEGVY